MTLMAFAPYVEKRIVPSLRDFVVAPARKRNLPPQWTNNDAESINHILVTGTLGVCFFLPAEQW